MVVVAAYPTERAVSFGSLGVADCALVDVTRLVDEFVVLSVELPPVSAESPTPSATPAAPATAITAISLARRRTSNRSLTLNGTQPRRCIDSE